MLTHDSFAHAGARAEAHVPPPVTDTGGRPRHGEGPVARALRFSSLGLQLVFSVLIGFGIGYFIDRALGTRPWFMLVFFVLGMVAGFTSIYREVRASERER